ncbi:MAG: helix-turn-helix transcriptional regulator [Terriglobia bacterium]
MAKGPSKLLVQFGGRVRELRQATGMSQEALADHCGLDRTYISSIERGKRNVSLENLKVLARALNVNLSELLEGL